MVTRRNSVLFFIASLILFILGVAWSLGPGSELIGVACPVLALTFFLLGVFKAGQEIEQEKAKETDLQEGMEES